MGRIGTLNYLLTKYFIIYKNQINTYYMFIIRVLFQITTTRFCITLSSIENLNSARFL